MIRKSILMTMIVVIFAAVVAASGCTNPATTPTSAPGSATTAATQASTSQPFTGTPDTVPKTYTGTGEQILGPISLKAASTTFHIKCDDAKNSEFIVNLQDSATGENVDSVGEHGRIYRNLKKGADMTEDTFDVTQTYTVPSAGNYLITVSSNATASWQVTVTQ